MRLKVEELGVGTVLQGGGAGGSLGGFGGRKMETADRCLETLDLLPIIFLPSNSGGAG